MNQGKKIWLIPLIATLLVLFLTAIGWLGHMFFGLVAARQPLATPFYTVATTAVQRASMRAAQSHEQIVLDHDGSITIPKTDPFPQESDETPLVPVLSCRYDAAITERPAWVNPLAHRATLTPNVVVVEILPLFHHEEAQP